MRCLKLSDSFLQVGHAEPLQIRLEGYCCEVLPADLIASCVPITNSGLPLVRYDLWFVRLPPENEIGPRHVDAFCVWCHGGPESLRAGHVIAPLLPILAAA